MGVKLPAFQTLVDALISNRPRAVLDAVEVSR